MADEFEQQKHRCLNQADLSKKGSIDEHIADLVQHINSLTNYFTTSSCSGRICVFTEDTDEKKKSGRWLFISHDSVQEAETVLQSVSNTEGNAIFKFEPFVLHVQCRTLDNAQSMLRVALESGYKNSGIVVGKKGRFILGVRSTQSLEVPIIHDGKLMVSNEYIRYLVEMANSKMEDNLSRIGRFFENIRTRLFRCDGSDDIKKKQKKKSPEEKPNKQTSKLEKIECEDMEDIIDSLSGFYEDHVS